MTEQTRYSRESQDKKELLPGRYRVGAKVDYWKHKGHIYEDQIMTLFQIEMDDDEAGTLLESLGFTPEKDGENYPYLVSQIEETFTEDQADQLIAFLEKNEGTTAWKKPAYKPIIGHAGAGSMKVGGSSDFYMFTEFDNYSLDFKAWGYYRVRFEEVGPASESLESRLEDLVSGLTLEQIQEVRNWIDKYIEINKEA
jgi:hypothetical protein